MSMTIEQMIDRLEAVPPGSVMSRRECREVAEALRSLASAPQQPEDRRLVDAASEIHQLKRIVYHLQRGERPIFSQREKIAQVMQEMSEQPSVAAVGSGKWKCSHCGHENYAHVEHCPGYKDGVRCGRSRQDSLPAAPAKPVRKICSHPCHQEWTQPMRCPRCGELV